MNAPRLSAIALALVAAGLLAACQGGGTPATRAAAVPKATPQALVADVRAIGERGEELEVAPLRDPHVEDLLARAQASEAGGRLRDAQEALGLALAITPEAPDLVQWQAELALLGKDWDGAERLASRSYELGPRLGGLCRRNWATIGHARDQRDDADGAAVARRQIDACTVAPPVRM